MDKNIIKEKDVEIEKIIIKYEDGTEKEITKGAVVNMTPEENTDEVTLNFEFIDFSGNDLTNLIYGITEMGVRMGLFEDNE